MMVIGGINAISGIISQNAKAKQVKADALDAQSFTMFQLNQNQNQITSQAALETQERARRGLKERAMLANSAGEYGVTGNTLERLMAVSEGQEAYDTGIVRTSETSAYNSLTSERKGVELRTQAAINNADASMIGGISAVSAVGLGAFQGYQTGQALNEQYQGIQKRPQIKKR